MEDLEFKEELVAKRHKELLQALKAIYDKLSTTPTTQDSLSKDIKILLKFIESSIKEPKNEQFPQEMKKILNAIALSLSSLKKEEKQDAEWTFSIERDSKGFIKTIDAKKL